MTTDLDERITRALTARAEAFTPTRPPLDDVLAGPGMAPAHGGGRRRTPLLVAAAVVALLVATAAAVVATRAGDDDVVDVSPAEEPTTTTPELGLAYLPPGLDGPPQEATSPDGTATVLTYGEGERALEVTVVEAERTPALESALDTRVTADIAAAYAAGGSAWATARADVPATPLADEIIGAPAGLPDRAGPGAALAQAGDDPLILLLDAVPAHGDRIEVGVIAFRAGAEVRIAGRGLRLDEALGVLAGIDGPGLAPRARPDEPEFTAAAPWAEDTPFLRPVVTVLPEGWALGSLWGMGGGLGGEDVVVGGAPEGATLFTGGYGPIGQEPHDPDAPFSPGPSLSVMLAHSTPLPQQQEVIDDGTDAELADFFDAHDLGIWASGGHSEVLRIDEVRLLMATGVIDETTVADIDGPIEMTRIDGWVGPNLQIEVSAQGMTEEQIVAAIRSLVLIR